MITPKEERNSDMALNEKKSTVALKEIKWTMTAKEGNKSLLTPKEEKRAEPVKGLPLGAVHHSLKRKKMSKDDGIVYLYGFQSIETSAKSISKKHKKKVKTHEHEYMVDRIMTREGERFLVSWSGWNLTWCSYCSMDDLTHSPYLMADFMIYDKGIDAIYKNVNSTVWYSQKEGRTLKKIDFKRRFVHKMKESMDDDQWNELLSGSNPEKLSEIGGLKYWRLKQVELQWLKVLNPDLDFKYPPLYLESMCSRSRRVPQIEFTMNYQFSDAAKHFFHKKTQTHKCIYGSSENYCKNCKERNIIILELNPDTLSDVVIPEDFTRNNCPIVILCNEFECRCSRDQGRTKCGRALQPYPRTDPLCVFYDFRYNGFGVRAMTDIPKGRIVSEYIGEVIMECEGADRDCTYQMGANGLIIDSKFKGNESRYFGHSCEPNMVIVPIYVEGYTMEHLHRFTLVTLRDIKAGEDLTFDYHPKSERPFRGYGKCECGTRSCRGWL